MNPQPITYPRTPDLLIVIIPPLILMTRQSRPSLSLLGFEYLNLTIVIFQGLINLYNSAYLTHFFYLFSISQPALFIHFLQLLVLIIVFNFVLRFDFICEWLLIFLVKIIAFFVLFLLLFVTQI